VVGLFIELGVAPLLAAASTVAARRWGERAGGVVSAFPAIVGPVLLLAALEHGPAFAARAANGTLLGLIGLAGFALGYGRLCRTRGWPLSLLWGWGCAAAGALIIGLGAGGAGPPAGLAVAVVSLLGAERGLPRVEAGPPPPERAQPRPLRLTLPVRLAITALLVTALAGADGALGPVAGGMLAALPVLACVLAVFSHRESGGDGAIAMLRGMLRGMAGFVAFCEVLALLIGNQGLWPALAAATASAVALQAVTIIRTPILQRAV
jgi:hypothetical protein